MAVLAFDHETDEPGTLLMKLILTGTPGQYVTFGCAESTGKALSVILKVITELVQPALVAVTVAIPTMSAPELLEANVHAGIELPVPEPVLIPSKLEFVTDQLYDVTGSAFVTKLITG